MVSRNFYRASLILTFKWRARFKGFWRTQTKTWIAIFFVHISLVWIIIRTSSWNKRTECTIKSKRTKTLHDHVNYMQWEMHVTQEAFTISYLDGEDLKKREIITWWYPRWRKAAKSLVTRFVGQAMNDHIRLLAFFKHFLRYIPQFDIRAWWYIEEIFFTVSSGNKQQKNNCKLNTVES